MWTFEQTCTNEIEIQKDGLKIASIVNDENDNTNTDFENAKFICNSCNEHERILSEKF